MLGRKIVAFSSVAPEKSARVSVVRSSRDPERSEPLNTPSVRSAPNRSTFVSRAPLKSSPARSSPDKFLPEKSTGFPAFAWNSECVTSLAVKSAAIAAAEAAHSINAGTKDRRFISNLSRMRLSYSHEHPVTPLPPNPHAASAPARTSLKLILSSRASKLASMILGETPTVIQRSPVTVSSVSASTRVTASVPPVRMRTL